MPVEQKGRGAVTHSGRPTVSVYIIVSDSLSFGMHLAVLVSFDLFMGAIVLSVRYLAVARTARCNSSSSLELYYLVPTVQYSIIVLQATGAVVHPDTSYEYHTLSARIMLLLQQL